MSVIMVLGGDGFCGWPTSLALSNLGHEVVIVDDLSRRYIDHRCGYKSLTEIRSVSERLDAWRTERPEAKIAFSHLDISDNPRGLVALLQIYQPDAVVHFAEQRSAPYSMRSSLTKRYTVNRNVAATHNLLNALVDGGHHDTHVVHLGTMGVYGYGTKGGGRIPEGYLEVGTADGLFEILHPTNPGSIYHMTKCMDQIMFAYYAKNDGLRITDLHQGIVWGTETKETALHPYLVNRYDYDGDYGTVLNRFLMQAQYGHPLTVHGTGGQTRAFIHIMDSVRCILEALQSPPDRFSRVRIINQMTETASVIGLARKVQMLTGCDISLVPNPRNEDAENDLLVDNQTVQGFDFEPITLEQGLPSELALARFQVSENKGRINPGTIPCTSTWTADQQPGVIDWSEEPD
jgi:UDP-sulfoquinovose synthase